jgi:hypothetical protein
MQQMSRPLSAPIEQLLESDLEKPWCVHRIARALSESLPESDRPVRFDVVEAAADHLVEAGRALGEKVSAISIGVHCQDSVYWSRKAPERQLEAFGPEYESPRILHRLAAHFECHGL